jgi:hypothetical protein
MEPNSCSFTLGNASACLRVLSFLNATRRTPQSALWARCFVLEAGVLFRASTDDAAMTGDVFLPREFFTDFTFQPCAHFLHAPIAAAAPYHAAHHDGTDASLFAFDTGAGGRPLGGPAGVGAMSAATGVPLRGPHLQALATGGVTTVGAFGLSVAARIGSRSPPPYALFFVSVPDLVDAIGACAVLQPAAPSPTTAAGGSTALPLSVAPGGAPPSGATASITVRFPDPEGRCAVEAANNAATMSCSVATRPLPLPFVAGAVDAAAGAGAGDFGADALDLRFGDSLLLNATALRGLVLRDAVADLHAMQCTSVGLQFQPTALAVIGGSSPFGDVRVEVERKGEHVAHYEVGDDVAEARVLLPHCAAALGIGAPRSGGGGGGHGTASGGGFGYDPQMLLGFAADGGIDRAVLQVNGARQIRVVHELSAPEGTAVVAFVIQPLVDLLAMA